MEIWGHTLVRNEERYLWFAVTSVIDYLDKLLLWDTGSTDNTLKIIRELRKRYGDKIIFRQVGRVDIDNFTKVRQEMLEETKGEWLFILDGDEVWWNDSIRKVRGTIENQGNKLEAIVNRYYNLVGDIYHYQRESAGKYKIDGVQGHLTIRAINLKIPGLSFSKPHGQQGVIDGDGVLIQDRDRDKRLFLDECTYLHFTHLIRSKDLNEDKKIIKRDFKYKYDLGKRFPIDYFYPEAFFNPKPHFVASPWLVRDLNYRLKAIITEPLRTIKRNFVYNNKSGY